VSPFDRLNAALRYHIVGTLGWTSLRPTQLEAIEPILAGENVLLLAPTAGGKTEAGMFPVISRVLDERWHGLSVLYVCPLRALLNNIEPRVHHYAAMVGRRAMLWHGDVANAKRRQILRDPPDILLTTPESLEAMLISSRVKHRDLFAALQTVVLDELHSFAGDDRGWHLLALLERLERLCGRPVQRIGLSATVGNPKTLMEWLGRGRAGRVVGAVSQKIEGDVHIDYVGSLENAAKVLARLYRGQRRLVFCDSRARVEALATRLREAGVRTFVSHSSLSGDERRRAEVAFAAEPDCVIVATSTLELGLDVGDLDRVVQIDSPLTVSSFLQRMGRTGRRAGNSRNCLMLATSTEALIIGLGVGRLWREGFVEQVQPPPSPFHIFAQQVMALALQEGGIARGDWTWWLGDVLTAANHQIEEAVISYMLANGILVEDGGVLGLGPEGEAKFGRRYFQELMAAFTTPLLLNVRYNRSDLGSVGPSSFTAQRGSAPVILLGGRSWRVLAVDWPRRSVSVEPAKEVGRSRWFGSSRALHSILARSVEQVLSTGDGGITLSTRARTALDEMRCEMPYFDGQTLPVVRATDSVRLWTFAGGRANAMLANALRSAGAFFRIVDNFGITFGATDERHLAAALDRVTEQDCGAPVDARMLSELKFGICLPARMAEDVLRARLSDFDALRLCLDRPRRWIRA
jgi:ATP-dependent helicase Lhr and Lhr-like helicase